MSFSNILKHLRRKNDMTQDDLAEALGLTPQAVSRWENGAAFPDSSVIRRLAYLFNVTTDYLLEVDPARIEDEIEKILADIRTMEPADAAQHLRDALNDYPCNLKLTAELGKTLYYFLYQRDPEARNAKKYLTEAIALQEYLYDHGHEDVYTLLGMYRDAGQVEKGKELLKTLSDYSSVRQEMEIELASGEEKIRLMQQNAYTLFAKLNWQVYMLSLEDHFTEEQKTAMLEQMYAAGCALMPDDDAWFRSWQPTHIPWQLAKHYSEAGNADKAMHWLYVMRDAAMQDEFEGERTFRMTSPAFAGYALKRNGQSWGTAWMLDVMGDGYFDNIRTDERFTNLYKELELSK